MTVRMKKATIDIEMISFSEAKLTLAINQLKWNYLSV